MGKKFLKIIFISLGMIFLLVGCSLTEAEKKTGEKGYTTILGSPPPNENDETTDEEEILDWLTSIPTDESSDEEDLLNWLNNAPIDENNEVNESAKVNQSTQISEEELWSWLNNLPIYVEKTGVLSSIARRNCLLSSIFWNNSDMDIRDVTIVYLAWDTNGLPLLLGFDYDEGEKTYDVACNYNGINMLPDTSYGEGTGIEIWDIPKENVGKVSAVMYSFTDFDGNEYYNPYFDYWLSFYSGKKL